MKPRDLSPEQLDVLLEAIGCGRGFAQTKATLAAVTDITERYIERGIQQLRLQGEPVCSDDHGYWLAESPQEAEEAAEGLQRRIVTQYATLRALRGTVRRWRDRMEVAPVPIVREPEQGGLGL